VLNRFFLILFFVFFLSFLQAQKEIDSTLIKQYPFRIGNIGFAVDSLEYFVGDIIKGEVVHEEIGMHNFGKKPISFRSGKISKFVEMNYTPATIQPGESGFAVIDFEVINELRPGLTQAEIAIESDDELNPYKFLYLVGNVVEDSSQFVYSVIIDTVPRMYFSEYNYDFGHLTRGRNVVHTFLFTNRGSQDLVIDEIRSTGCSIIAPPQKVIPPGEDGALVVKVNTMGDFGVQHRTVSITSNDPIHPTIVLGLHGTVRQEAPSKLNPDFCYE
jgi:hypothetical protein